LPAAALIMALLNRLPILVWAGAALLGWIAGDVIATDPAVHPKLQALFAGPAGVKLDAVGVARDRAALCKRQRRGGCLRRVGRHRRADRGVDLAEAQAAAS
jgi:Membrane protein TerC, possibly involved in tellurium resistance